ncbi:MAG: hypothetical protein M3Q07_08490 [Pseudobdellovibrionaceae bacterium]|nr:hypothetical protein [Pseudobdellovibrionaceae bacterium]
MTGHSTSLVARFVSPINPRVILFTATKDATTAIADSVVMGFVRGDQFVELIALEPKFGKLNFFLVSSHRPVMKAVAAPRVICSPPRLKASGQAITIYEDIHLNNTVFDCTHWPPDR